MKTHTYYSIMTELLAKHDLYNKGWRAELKDMKRTAGYCDYNSNKIVLNEYYLKHNSDEEIWNTMLHELAHALTPNVQSHGKEWKNQFRKLCVLYKQPVNTERCYDSNKVKMPEKRYKTECTNCKASYSRYRMSFTKRLAYLQGNYRCRKCASDKFNVYDNNIKVSLLDVLNIARKKATYYCDRLHYQTCYEQEIGKSVNIKKEK